jgi:peptidyl-prolyl cis-trans isomerase SurA
VGGIKYLGWTRRALAPLLVSALAVTGIAQTAPDADNGVPEAGLNLPSQVTLFGQSRDPNIRTATAIVNGDVITGTDVDQRLALVLTANQGKVEGEERERLRLQVLRNLIDETLQIQEAKANEITITPEEVNQTYDRVATNFKRKPDEFAAYLRTQGSSDKSIKRQIEGELAWQRLLRRRVEPFVSVADEEVKSVIARLNASKGEQEFRIGEIFLSATPETSAQVLVNANRIIDQIKGGASFPAYARQFSEASTAAVGGDLGWVRTAQLPEPIAQAAQEMQPGQVSSPIPVPGGFSIVALQDKRQVLGSDPRDALLSVKQIALTFAPGTTQASATPKVEALTEASRKITGCGTVEEIAAKLGAEVAKSDAVPVRDLPPALQQIMLKLNIGQATQPFGSLTDGVRVLVLCGRDDAAANDGPSYDQIYAQIEEQRVDRRARRYLRDLRRDAVVDYR